MEVPTLRLFNAHCDGLNSYSVVDELIGGRFTPQMTSHTGSKTMIEVRRVDPTAHDGGRGKVRWHPARSDLWAQHPRQLLPPL